MKIQGAARLYVASLYCGKILHSEATHLSPRIHGCVAAPGQAPSRVSRVSAAVVEIAATVIEGDF